MARQCLLVIRAERKITTNKAGLLAPVTRSQGHPLGIHHVDRKHVRVRADRFEPVIQARHSGQVVRVMQYLLDICQAAQDKWHAFELVENRLQIQCNDLQLATACNVQFVTCLTGSECVDGKKSTAAQSAAAVMVRLVLREVMSGDDYAEDGSQWRQQRWH